MVFIAASDGHFAHGDCHHVLFRSVDFRILDGGIMSCVGHAAEVVLWNLTFTQTPGSSKFVLCLSHKYIIFVLYLFENHARENTLKFKFLFVIPEAREYKDLITFSAFQTCF